MAYVVACTLPLVAAACGARQAAPPQTAQVVRQGAVVVMGQDRARTAQYAPAGTAFNATLDQPVDTRLSSPGESVSATLTQPILALNGDVLVPEGTQLRGRIYAIFHAPTPRIVLGFDLLALRGGAVPVGVSILSVPESRYRTLPAAPRPATSAPGVTARQPSAPEPQEGDPQVSVAKGAVLRLSLSTPIVEGP
jgi:hypothetical protein